MVKVHSGGKLAPPPTAQDTTCYLVSSTSIRISFPTTIASIHALHCCFLMYPRELRTAAQHGAKLVVIVVNNGTYGTIRMHQERRYPGRVVGPDLVNPHFVNFARSCGAFAERVETTGPSLMRSYVRSLPAGRRYFS